jgi:hypothetical protein
MLYKYFILNTNKRYSYKETNTKKIHTSNNRQEEKKQQNLTTLKIILKRQQK